MKQSSWKGFFRTRKSPPPPKNEPPVKGQGPAVREYRLEEPGVSIVNEGEVRAREVRVALTMVGGTSLAIYENGVAQEFYRMVHGQGMYGLLKRITQSHAYVDVLSGTSAGGINTICLSAALTAGTDFRPTREVWIGLGGIDALLQPPGNAQARSLLQGNGYYLEELNRTFKTLSNDSDGVRWSEPILPSGKPGMEQYTDLDLFVTGTYLTGQPQAFFDARNQPIFSHNYAGVFHLKHRPRRNESHFHASMTEPYSPYSSDNPNDPKVPWPGSAEKARRVDAISLRLGRIARTTSSLPAVFEPSQVDRSLMNGVVELPKQFPYLFMGDGGYLNNNPIDLLVKEIAKRPTSREVLRKAFMVTPEPEEIRPQVEDGKTVLPEPNALKHLWLYRDIPHRQTVADTLRAVSEHNRKVSRVGEALDQARKMVGRLDSGSNGKGNGKGAGNREDFCCSEELWVRICLRNLRMQLVGLWERALDIEGFGGVEELADDRAVRDPLKAHKERARRAQQLRIIGRLLLERMEASCEDLFEDSVSPPLPFSLDEIDVDYFDRKIHRAIDEIYAALYPRSDGGGGRFQNREIVSAYIRELYHLRDLSEIAGINLANVLGTVALSEEYRRAAEAAFGEETSEKARSVGGAEGESSRSFKDTGSLQNKIEADRPDEAQTAVDELWELLVASARRLLRPLDGWLRSPDDDLLGRESAEQRQARHNAEADQLRKVLEGNEQHKGIGKQICEILVERDPSGPSSPPGQPPTDERPHARRVQAIRGIKVDYKSLFDSPDKSSPPGTLLEQLGRRANEWVQAAAIDLAERAPDTAGDRNDKRETPIALAQNLALRAVALKSAGDQPPKVPAENGARADGPEQDPLAQDGLARDVLTAERIGVNLRRLDQCLYPLEQMAGVVSRHPIELVQISPRDVQIGLSEGSPRDKIAGNELMNFSGFLKASWRGNDILCGRLDASGAILETLLDRDRLKTILDCPLGEGKSVPDRILDALDAYVLQGNGCAASPAPGVPTDDLGQYLNGDYQRDRSAMESWLRSGYRGAADTTGLDLLRKWVLKRHQMQILAEEIPDVIAEEIAEHACWQGRDEAEELDTLVALDGQMSESGGPSGVTSQQLTDDMANVAGANANPSTLFLFRQTARSWARRALGGPDPERLYNYFSRDNVTDANANPSPLFLFRRTARLWARRALGGPDPERLYNYFSRDKKYRVGRETVQENIPPLVSVRRALQGLLVGIHVLQNATTDQMGGSLADGAAKKVLKPLEWVVGALYGFFNVIAQGRAAAAAMHAVTWTLILLLGGMIDWSHPTTHPFMFGVFTVAVLAEWVWWWGKGRALAGLLFVAAALGAVFYARLTPPQSWVDGVTALGKMGRLFLLGGAGMILTAVLALSRRNLSPPFRFLKRNARITLFALMLALIVAALATFVPLNRLLIDLSGGDASIKTPVPPRVEWAVFSAAPPAAPDPKDSPESYGIVDFEFARTPDRAGKILESWGRSGGLTVLCALGVDFFFLIGYSVALALACAGIGGLYRRRWVRDWGYLLAWGALLAGALDAAENGLLMTLLLRYLNGQSLPSFVPAAAFGCAAVKFALAFAAAGYVVLAGPLALTPLRGPRPSRTRPAPSERVAEIRA